MDPSRLPALGGDLRVALPWSGMGKFLCIGLNYSGPRRRDRRADPEEPILFMKPTDLCRRPERHRRAAAGVEEERLGGSSWASSSAELRAMSTRARRSHMLPATASSTTCRARYQDERGGTWGQGKG
jgi:2-keto-4-pentenoate hydratase/2-oxohepta-3-ene-1,7-dioic acid hydratase in catechol pathway